MLFAGVHLDPWRFPAFVPYGLVLAAVFARTRSLRSSIVAHMVDNASAFAVLLAA